MRDRAGGPVPGASVYVLSAPVAVPDIAALTDATGAFALTLPAAGTYAIGATAAGFAPASLTVAVTAEPGQRLELLLDPAS